MRSFKRFESGFLFLAISLYPHPSIAQNPSKRPTPKSFEYKVKSRQGLLLQQLVNERWTGDNQQYYRERKMIQSKFSRNDPDIEDTIDRFRHESELDPYDAMKAFRWMVAYNYALSTKGYKTRQRGVDSESRCTILTRPPSPACPEYAYYLYAHYSTISTPDTRQLIIRFGNRLLPVYKAEKRRYYALLVYQSTVLILTQSKEQFDLGFDYAQQAANYNPAYLGYLANAYLIRFDEKRDPEDARKCIAALQVTVDDPQTSQWDRNIASKYIESLKRQLDKLKKVQII